MPEAITDLACPECAVRLPPDQLDSHIRRVHRIFRFRGVRRSLNDTLSTLVRLLGSLDDVAEAWPFLEAIAIEEYGQRAEAFLASVASQALARIHAAEALFEVTAQAIAAGMLAPRLLALLAAEPEVAPRHLALRIMGHLTVPLDGAMVSALRPLLSDKRLPLDTLLDSTAALIQSTGKEGPAAAKVFQALINGWGKSRGIDRLLWLEQRIGTSATLTAIRGHLEDRQRLSCPRCSVEMRRPKMIEHLWEQHRLVLDGRRVREPWDMLEDWVKDLPGATDSQAAEGLARCRALAARIDPEKGLSRLLRLMLARGMGDDESRQVLLDEAAARGASLCPHCFAGVPAPVTSPPRALNVYKGRVSALGYRVEVADHSLFTRLEIVTPNGFLRRGPEPNRRLTYAGAMLLFAGPPVALAALISFGLAAPLLPPLIPVALLLLGAGIIGWFVSVTWRQRVPAGDRAVDYAWLYLAPRLHANGFSLTDSAFAAALAWTSLTRGRRPIRTAEVERLVNLTETAVSSGIGVVEHLADLRRLAIEDARASGSDPVPLVVAQITRSLEGKLPLGYAERLLAGWESPWWTKVALTRLRVLLCDRAFETGFEVANLLEVSQVAPTLGAVLETENVEGLACLRLLWSMRARTPWDRGGPALTVFELAGDAMASAPHLQAHPDLLLLQETKDWRMGQEGEEQPIKICCRGVVFQDVLFDYQPEMLEIVELRGGLRGGFLVSVDAEEFWLRNDPQKLTDCFERWLRFFFSDFRANVAAVKKWRPPTDAVTLRALQVVPCPECGRPVRPRAGQVGVALAVS